MLSYFCRCCKKDGDDRMQCLDCLIIMALGEVDYEWILFYGCRKGGKEERSCRRGD